MEKDFESFQGSDDVYESTKKAYKEAPGLYRELGMKIINKIVAKLEGEYPRLKTLRYDIKQAWVTNLVVALVHHTEDLGSPITKEQLKLAQDELENFTEKSLREYFEGEQARDELLWEQEMKEENK